MPDCCRCTTVLKVTRDGQVQCGSVADHRCRSILSSDSPLCPSTTWGHEKFPVLHPGSTDPIDPVTTVPFVRPEKATLHCERQ